MTWCWIFDLEGTLTNNEHRIHLAQLGRWDEYGELLQLDPPNEHIITLWRSLEGRTKRVISTGLHLKHRPIAQRWLQAQGISPDIPTMYRTDHRPSPELKKEHLGRILERGWRVQCAVDDRLKNVDMFTQEGIPCLIPSQRSNY